MPALPGMPNAMVGTSAPASLELFALSGARTPSTTPVPKSLPFLALCLPCP